MVNFLDRGWHSRYLASVTVYGNFANCENEGQALELLPGTASRAGNSIWVVIPQGCTLANPSLVGCDLMRGHLFMPNQSTTWSTSRLANNGLYNLDTYPEDM